MKFGAVEPPFADLILGKRSGSIAPSFMRRHPSGKLMLSNRPCLFPYLQWIPQRFDSTIFLIGKSGVLKSGRHSLSPRTQLQGIQTDSGRIQLNTARIQDSRFKVPGRSLPCTLNLESEAYSIDPVVGSGARVLYSTTCKKVRIYRHSPRAQEPTPF